MSDCNYGNTVSSMRCACVIARRTIPILIVALIAIPVFADDRPENWAQPLELDGVPNLFKLTDGLYRSAQPSARGMRALKDLGVETIVNLRSFHSDRNEIGSTGLGYEHIHMKAWHPEEKELVRFLQIVTNEKRAPVLVHCQHGADRTGLMCAVYRIVVEDWTKEDAIQEMTGGGYGFHPLWTNIIKSIQDLDVEQIREKAGLAKTEGAPRP